jgi:drug/metabolite transporter (DMT)-like permease
VRYEGELKIIGGAAAFALIPVFAILGKDLSVYCLLLGRLIFASLILCILIKNKKEIFNISLKKILFLTFWSLLMLGAMITYFLSIHISGMAVSAAILGIQPLFIVILSGILLKEKISLLTWFSCFICVIGIVLVSGIDGFSNLDSSVGILLAIASALFLSFNFLLKKMYLNDISGINIVFYQCIFQIPFLIPFIFIEPGNLNMDGILASFLLGLICTVVSYVLIYDGIEKVKAQQIGILQSIENVLPVFIGVLFYSEQMNLLSGVGVFLIIGSTIMITLFTKQV